MTLHPSRTVICPTVVVPPGPSPGVIQNTAPLSTVTPALAVQEAQSIPMLLIAPAESPSVMPTVSHESKAAVGDAGMNRGLTPPVLAPKGAAAWYAAGRAIGLSTSPYKV